MGLKTETTIPQPNEVTGTTPGAMTFEEYKNQITRGLILFGDSLSSRLKKTAAKADFNTSSTESVEESPKFAVDTAGNSYMAGGVITADRQVGGITVTQAGTAKQQPILQSSNKSGFFSSPAGTVLGSVDIRTLGAEVLNPLMTDLPSSHMSPLTTWTKTLFPITSQNNILLISVLEGISAILLSALGKAREPKSGEGEVKITRQNFDMGTVIIDHKDLQQTIINREIRNN